MIARLPPLLLAFLAGSLLTFSARATNSGPSTFSETAPSTQVQSITLATPDGWTRQEDPVNHVVTLHPTNPAVASSVALVISPLMESNATAASFQSDMLAKAVAGGKLLAPVQSGTRNGMLASSTHLQSSGGQRVWLLVYTARWANQGQALVFAAEREDLFKAYLPTIHSAISAANIPTEAAGPVRSAVSQPPLAPDTRSTIPSTNVSSDSRSMTTNEPSADMIPVLAYDEPAHFYRGASKNFAEYSSSEVNYTLCVYPFRDYTGNIVTQFQQTLLRDWVDIRHQEQPLAGAPAITSSQMPGADAVYQARFHEQKIGQANERMRILVVVGNRAALVDAVAPNTFCWQKVGPTVVAMLSSLHIEQRQGPPSVSAGPGPNGAALAGLYAGIKAKYMAYGFVDATSHIQARHFYLLSADGRVFRCYDNPPANGNWQQFDFDQALRTDPMNTGRFAVRGNELFIQLNGPNHDQVSTTISDPSELVLDTVKYVRVQ